MKIANIFKSSMLSMAMLSTLGIPTVAHADFSFTFPDGVACAGFALQLDGAGGNQHFKEFTNKNGIVRAISAGTGSSIRYTNLTTGATFSTKSNGAVTHTTFNADGSTTLKLTGHNVVIMFPTDSPPGPSTTVYVGSVTLLNDLGGSTTVLKATGNTIDVCAAVAH